MALYLDVEVGDSVRIGEALVTVVQKNGRRARLCVDVKQSVKIKHEKNLDAVNQRKYDKAASH